MLCVVCACSMFVITFLIYDVQSATSKLLELLHSVLCNTANVNVQLFSQVM